jgi:radical SAM-linked protein
LIVIMPSPTLQGRAGAKNLNRYRITFARDDTVRFVGHLDLAKSWERIFRRADLPVAYSQGFHPQPKITFASALPVGCTSEAEVMDVVLNEPLDPAEMARRTTPTLPAGIAITSIVEAPLNAPALQAALRWAKYVVTVGINETKEQVEARVQTLLAAPSLMRVRRGKTYDLRPLILSLTVESVRPSSVGIAMQLSADADAGTGRPDEVVAALGWSDAPVQIHRRELGFEALEVS